MLDEATLHAMFEGRGYMMIMMTTTMMLMNGKDNPLVPKSFGHKNAINRNIKRDTGNKKKN